MTIEQVLRASGIDAREARLLLAAATGRSEASVLAHPEKSLLEQEKNQFAEMTARRAAGEPIAYILGHKEFYGLELTVNSAVLIPRPETELLVDLALDRNPASVLDVGTGSGAIALAIKRHRPDARVVATDASAAALEVARRNAARFNLEVELRHGRWFEPVAGERFEAIISNPPYVVVGDPHLAALPYEPRLALLGGADGLDGFRVLAREAPAHLLPGGWLLVEHGEGQHEAVRGLLEAAGLETT
ncbi:MAG TPA: peptide chain release factor N(5)-glutamine methyltransferase, partial [Burkholderiales bacterium]|nr:peptide chain release factor N(5)-glutamine methyltransferase [Burkholderiales bacterium]